MISKSFNNFFGFLIIILFSTVLNGEEKIDIWKNKNEKKEEISQTNDEQTKENKIDFEKILNSNPNQNITIENTLIDKDKEVKVFGVYDPADYDFNLNMWSLTKAEDVRASLKRLKKIKLSQTSNEILENILLSFSYPPEGMKSDEFVNLKVNWLIDNNRSDLIENFLKQNKEFEGKSRAVQYLVDQNIADAALKKAVKKLNLLMRQLKILI